MQKKTLFNSGSNKSDQGSSSGSNAGASTSGPVAEYKGPPTGQTPLLKLVLVFFEHFLNQKKLLIQKKIEDARLKPNSGDEQKQLAEELKKEEERVAERKNVIARGVCLAYSVKSADSFYADDLAALLLRNNLIATRVPSLAADAEAKQDFDLLKEFFTPETTKVAKEVAKPAEDFKFTPVPTQTEALEPKKSGKRVYNRDVRAFLTALGFLQFGEEFKENFMTDTDYVAGLFFQQAADLVTSKRVEEKEGGLEFPASWSGYFANKLNTSNLISLLNKQALELNSELAFVFWGQPGDMSLSKQDENHAISLCFRPAKDKQPARWEFIDANEFPYIYHYSTTEDENDPDFKSDPQFKGNIHDLARKLYTNINFDRNAQLQGSQTTPLKILTIQPVTTLKRQTVMATCVKGVEAHPVFEGITNPFQMYQNIEKLKEALKYAVQNGQIHFVKRVIEQCEKKEDCSPSNKNFLLNEALIKHAMEYGQEDIAILLIKSGKIKFDINKIAAFAYTNDLSRAFYWLIKSQKNWDLSLFPGILEPENREFLKILLAFGNVNNQSPQQSQTLVYQAVNGNDDELLDLLLQHGGNVNIKDRQGWTPLFAAVHKAAVGIKDKKPDDKMLRVLYKYGLVNPKAEMKITQKPDPQKLKVFFADRVGGKLSLEDFLKTLPPDLKSDKKAESMSDGQLPHDHVDIAQSKTLFVLAAKIGDRAEITRLVGKKSATDIVDANTCDENGKTALYHAIKAKDVLTIELLVNHQADQLEKNGPKKPLIHNLVLMGDLKLLRAFAFRLADSKQQGDNKIGLNMQDENGETALHLAIRKNNMDALKALLQCGADVNIRDKNGWSPLRLAMEFAAKDKDLRAFKILLQASDIATDIHWQALDKEKYSPLFYAARQALEADNPDAQKMLIEFFKYGLVLPNEARAENPVNAGKAIIIFHDKIFTLKNYFNGYGKAHILENVIKQAEKEMDAAKWFNAVKRGDLAEMKSLVEKKNFDINICDDTNKKNALDYANEGHYVKEEIRREVIMFLLDRKAIRTTSVSPPAPDLPPYPTVPRGGLQPPLPLLPPQGTMFQDKKDQGISKAKQTTGFDPPKNS